ncbi:TniQ family protein [Shewanella sp. SG41-4]|uniref:TniQ family protein n=1 Tax=Shewanella sp. SG41-4 TaxID=2760976 RepID=UPI0016011349|nr:TniQ family protein [Shewanella sp. SG41-4]MBB1440638.1 TniQ family protein [Shewanella sp. SG41-4]
MSNFLTINEEESLTGFTLRQEFIFTSGVTNSLLKIIGGDRKALNFPKKVEFTGLQNKTMVEVLSMHTVYPLLKYTSDYHLKTELIDIFIHGYSEQRRALEKQLFQYAELRYCPKCFIDQLRQYGFCWLLRVWQAPLVTACHIHNIKLCKYSCDCIDGPFATKNFLVGLFTGSCPECHCNTWTEAYCKSSLSERRTAKWMSEILMYPPIHLSRAVNLSLVLDFIEKSGINHLSKKEQLDFLTKKCAKQQKSLNEEYLHKQIKAIVNSFKLPLDSKIFYSLAISTFKSASDFYSHINSCGSVGYLNIKKHDEHFKENKQVTLVDEDYIQDIKPDDMNDNWIRLII